MSGRQTCPPKAQSLSRRRLSGAGSQALRLPGPGRLVRQSHAKGVSFELFDFASALHLGLPHVSPRPATRPAMEVHDPAVAPHGLFSFLCSFIAGACFAAVDGH